jgi:ADP-ribose pyrophosphatase YjhB (NUDIX family)
MSFLRLGTRVAVMNDSGEILLSKRGDFGTWALPGGRVDNHELIENTAIREVREETGLEVEIVRPVGLYYQQGRQRMDILYRAKAIGGELFKATEETLDNRFFKPDNLPEPLFGHLQIEHAYSDKTYVYTIETPVWTLLKLDMQLRWRWINNLLAGRPEPKFPQFTVWAVGIIRNGDKVFVQDGKLPRITSDGNSSLWLALNLQVHKSIKQALDWKWIGLWQDVNTNTMEFVFEAESQAKNGDWRDSQDVESEYLNMPKNRVWVLGNVHEH